MILSSDPITRNIERIHDDPDVPGGVIIENVYDAQPIFERNQALRNQTDERARWTKRGGDDRGLGELVGSIPMVVWYQIPEEIRENGKLLLKWLANKDQQPFQCRSAGIYRPGR